MSEYVSRCYRCLAPNPAWGTTLCAACRQIESIEKSSREARDAAEENAQLMAEQARANARMQAEIQEELYAQNERNAQLARRQARENARLAAEGGVSYEDAYQYGFHYLESTAKHVKFNLTLDGEIGIERDIFWDPYTMEHLVQAFDRGFAASLKNLNLVGPGPDYIDGCVYNAGHDFMPSFYLSYNQEVGGVERVFKTGTYNTNFNRKVNLETGEVEYYYDNPFTDNEGLNLTYMAGVNNRYTELDENTPEQLEERLQTEVAEILAAQAAQVKQQKDEIDSQIKEAKAEINAGNMAVVGVVVMLIITAVLAVTLWNENRGLAAIASVIGGIWVVVLVWSKSLSDVYERAEWATSRLHRLQNN